MQHLNAPRATSVERRHLISQLAIDKISRCHISTLTATICEALSASSFYYDDLLALWIQFALKEKICITAMVAHVKRKNTVCSLTCSDAPQIAAIMTLTASL